jgi:hypothetical protein
MCSISGQNDACRDCGKSVRARKAIEMLADTSLFGRDGPPELRHFSSPSHVLVSFGVWCVPVIPAVLDPNAVTRTAVSIFAARNNIGRPHVSLYNFLTSALPFWQFMYQFVNNGRIPTPYLFDSIRACDFMLVVRNVQRGHPVSLLCDVTEQECSVDPVLSVLQDVSRRGGDVSFCNPFTSVSRSTAIAALQDSATRYDVTAPFLDRFFSTYTELNLPFTSNVTGLSTLKAYRVTHDASNANVPSHLVRNEVGLLCHYASMAYRTLQEDLTDAYKYALVKTDDTYLRERTILQQVMPAVFEYIKTCKTHLANVEAVARYEPTPPSPGEDEGLSSDMMRVMYGSNYAAHEGSLFHRLNKLVSHSFQRGDRVIKLTTVVSAIGSAGGGTKLIDAAKALATRAGAWLILEAVTWPLLPFRFYFQQGFDFISPRSVNTTARVEKWNEGTVWMAWKPDVPIRNSKDGDRTWTSRELSMSKMENSNGEILIDPTGSYSPFMERVHAVSKARSVPVVISRPSRYVNTICILFDSAFVAYRRRALPAFIASFSTPPVHNINMNHCRSPSVRMNNTTELNEVETIAERELKLFGAGTICSPDTRAGIKRGRETESPTSP